MMPGTDIIASPSVNLTFTSQLFGRWRYTKAPQGFLSSGDCYNRSFDACLPDCSTDGWRITLAGSRLLTLAEQRYAPIEGEALAVARGLEQSTYFTQGCNDLLVVTDHKLLVKILGDRTLYEISNTRICCIKQRTLPW